MDLKLVCVEWYAQQYDWKEEKSGLKTIHVSNNPSEFLQQWMETYDSKTIYHL